MNPYKIKKANSSNIIDLLNIEKRCFLKRQRSTTSSMKYSLKSKRQSVWFAYLKDKNNKSTIAGALILRHNNLSIRIFSIAILPEFQNLGLGSILLNFAENIAIKEKKSFIYLEASKNNKKLIQWYKNKGFKTFKILKDYYETNYDALQMKKIL
ncbi:MAG: N-acetyltransferase [Pseudomonadota bacterium]